MTAAALSHKLAGLPVKVTLVESDEIGTVGVGEATLPAIRSFNKALNIDEAALMRFTEATYKLGIEFCNWGKIGDRYIHPFGDYGHKIDGIPFYQYWLRLKQLGKAHRLDEYSYPIVASEQSRFRHPSEDPDAVESTFGYAYQFDAIRYAAFLRKFAEEKGAVRIEGKVVTTTLDPESGNVASVTLNSGAV
ncbi:MAG: tryptophan 7-halogenase, partial [Asticcacaulis sp.]